MDVMDKLTNVAKDITINNLADAAAEHTQVLGNLAGLMLPVPKQMQEVTARAVSLVAYEAINTLFELSIPLSQFNTVGFSLKKVQAELEELQRKNGILRTTQETIAL